MYSADFIGTVHTPRSVNGGNGWERTRGNLLIDFGKFTPLKGLSFFATGPWQGGVNVGGQTLGSIANPSSLASKQTARLDAFWFEQALFDNRLFLKLGQWGAQDNYGGQQNLEEHLLEPLGFAFGNEFSAVFSPFDPAGVPAAEVRVWPTHNFNFRTAIFSGNRNPFDDATGVHFDIFNTPVEASEVGFVVDSPELSQGAYAPLPGRIKPAPKDEKNYPGLYKFGSLYNHGEFKDLRNQEVGVGNYLVYGMADQAVYRAEAGSKRGLDVHFGFDWSPDDVNQVNSEITGGFGYNGLIPHRGDDAAALGFVYNRVSDEFRRVQALQGVNIGKGETAFDFRAIARRRLPG